MRTISYVHLQWLLELAYDEALRLMSGGLVAIPRGASSLGSRNACDFVALFSASDLQSSSPALGISLAVLFLRLNRSLPGKGVSRSRLQWLFLKPTLPIVPLPLFFHRESKDRTIYIRLFPSFLRPGCNQAPDLFRARTALCTGLCKSCSFGFQKRGLGRRESCLVSVGGMVNGGNGPLWTAYGVRRTVHCALRTVRSMFQRDPASRSPASWRLWGLRNLQP